MQKKVVTAFKILWYYCDEKGGEGFAAFVSLFFICPIGTVIA